MELQLSRELPTTTLDLYYFIFAVLNQRKSFLFDYLDDNLTMTSIEAMHDTFYQYLSSKALNSIKPDRKIIYGDDFNNALLTAKELCTQVAICDGKISTNHMMLAILKNEDDNNKIRQVFNKAGIVYKYAYDKMIDINNSDYDDTNEKFKVIKITAEPGENITEKIKDAINKVNFQNEGKDNLLPGTNKKLKGRNANIKAYCSNLNELVDAGKIEPIIGRENETNSIIRILGRKRKNNVILLGSEGVGKTAIAENIAYLINNGSVPSFMLDKIIISLDMTALLAGTTLRGMFEERVKGLLDEIKADNRFILFIDNIGAALADNGKNDYEISSMLSRALENGECQVIGTSDYKSYRKTFTKDPSLARRFQTITVNAPSIDESIKILKGVQKSYENFHHVKYNDGVIESCVKLASKYITERNLPDSAIDVLDEVGACLGTIVDDQRIKNITQEIKSLKEEITSLRKKDMYEESDKKARELNDKNKEFKELSESIERNKIENPIVVNISDILDIISSKTGIPVSELTSDDKKKLMDMNERLKKEVIGQDDAIDTICKALKRNRIGLRKHGCMYSAMMIGKTGTGKTLIAKKLAKEIFGSETSMVRFDMSEFPDKVAVSKLIGSNPGYVGYEEGGQLTEAIKKNKYCVLLLDEIEKADPEIYNIFLQVLDEGFLTDNSGQKVDFGNVIVLFTSNIGAKAASDFAKGIGFNENVDDNTKRIMTRQLKNRFPPEFINRIDNLIYFNTLNDDNLREIIKIEINKLSNNIEELGFKLSYNKYVVDIILDSIKLESDFGARPIMRSIQDNIEDKITDSILENDFENGHEFKLKVEGGKIIVK